MAAKTLTPSGPFMPSSSKPSQIKFGTLLIGPPKSKQPRKPITKPYKTFEDVSNPFINAVNPSVSQTIGPPTTKYMIKPAIMADRTGIIIIGIKATAHFGTFSFSFMSKAV